MTHELCDNCAAPAAFSIDEGDGNYCSYACNVCIELWFPDGPDPRSTRPLPTRPDPVIVHLVRR